jgi:hypothetical protein
MAGKTKINAGRLTSKAQGKVMKVLPAKAKTVLHPKEQSPDRQSSEGSYLAWHGKRDVRVEKVPDPILKEPNDAIIKVTSSGICGSDLDTCTRYSSPLCAISKTRVL